MKHLIDAANKVCRREISTPTLTSIRTMANQVITIADRMQAKKIENLSTKAVDHCINLMQSKWLNQILCGDARQVLSKLPNQSVDLIFTSPPYANQRS